MMIILIIFGIIIYIIGICLYISFITEIDTKVHFDNSFWGYFTTTHCRDTTTKDAWFSLIWPIFFIISILKHILWLINELIIFPALLLGIKYTDTKIYKKFEDLI